MCERVKVLKERIMALLIQHEDAIMESTLGSALDEYDERYATVYSSEWRDHKHDIAWVVAELIVCGVSVTAEGFAYVVISEWAGVMTFDEGDLALPKLTAVCAEILLSLVD